MVTQHKFLDYMYLEDGIIPALATFLESNISFPLLKCLP